MAQNWPTFGDWILNVFLQSTLYPTVNATLWLYGDFLIELDVLHLISVNRAGRGQNQSKRNSSNT